MSASARSQQGYQPVTFAERGVLVPFTTPLLAGSRARPGERLGPELMVPNPAGGRGVYVVPWSSVSELCRPTVHDRRLNQKVEALITVTPGSIRQAAGEVALEGLAGREAQVAAATAVNLDDRGRALVRFLLTLALAEQVEARHHDLSQFSSPSDLLEQQALQTLEHGGSRLGLMAATISTDLEQLAAVFGAVGLQGQRQSARVIILLEMLSRLHEETTAFSQERRDEDGELAAMIAEVAGATLTCAATTVRDARRITGNPVELVRQWNTNPDQIKPLAARPEWLLDGWERICLLWQDAEMPGAREAALGEMATLVPVLPRETCDWVRLSLQPYSLFTYRRTVSLNEDWRSGSSVIELVSRNERLRARSV